jgi:hypothetical protein
MEMLDVQRLNDMRQRILAGEEFSIEEYKDIILAYRKMRGTVDLIPTTEKGEKAVKAKQSQMPLTDLLAVLSKKQGGG